MSAFSRGVLPALLVTMLLGATACGSGDPAPAGSAPATGSPSPTTGGAAMTDGRHTGRVMELDLQRMVLAHNPVELFAGAEAARACAEDGKQGDAAWCNDYYIRDPSPELVEVPVAPEATAKLYFSGVSCPQEPCAVPLRRLAREVADRSARKGAGLLGTVVVQGGKVVFVEHIYTP